MGALSSAMPRPATSVVALPRHRLAKAEPVYVGRIGLIDATGTPLLVGRRIPAAEPFFAATLADPRCVIYRRRCRWTGGRIVDYWDEVLNDDDNVSSRVSPDVAKFASQAGGSGGAVGIDDHVGGCELTATLRSVAAAVVSVAYAIHPRSRVLTALLGDTP